MALFGPRRIGLALGSGAARGIAHIGVLRVLESASLRPDVIAGTSMGALVGALYAAGICAADLESIALDFDLREIVGVGEVAFGRGAVFSGAKVQDFLRRYLPPTFEDLSIPFGCVATDITRNAAVRFTSGDLIAAVRASVSVPLAFLPVRMDDALLIDGFACEPVPVSLARHLGAQVVVAVDVCGSGIVNLSPDGVTPSAPRRLRDLRENIKNGTPFERGDTGLDVLGAVSEAFEARVAAPELKTADIVVSPAVHHLAGFSFGQAACAIEAGEQAMTDAVAEVRRKARRPQRGSS